jgi:predicted MFS family arabinose efflux permease
MRRTVVSFYALILLTEIVWTAIVPLAPVYGRTFDLSSFQTGAVLAAAGVATLAVSLPVGLLSDRVGARTLVIASSAVMTLSTLGQGLANDFWSLLLSRAACGVALGAVWTAGLAWMAQVSTGPERQSALGFPTTVAGVGIVIGPAFAGLLAGATNVHVPFLLLTALSALLTVALARTPRGAGAHVEREPLGHTLGKAGRDSVLLGSIVVMGVIGLVGGSINLLVPLQLRAEGLGPGATGLAMSASSLVFVVASVYVARRPGALSLRFVGAAAVLYGLTMLLVTADTSAPSLITFVLVRAPFWAALATLAFPLGAVGAIRAGVGIGAANGLLNLVWGAAGSAGPLAAGALDQAVGPSVVFAVLAVACGIVGAGLIAIAPPGRLEAAPARSDPAHG